jgi:hypothetical protein
MKVFKVYKHPVSGYEAVKIGFSWPGFFWNGIWLLQKRLWGIAVLWFLVMFLLVFIVQVTDKEPGGGQQAIVDIAVILWNLAASLIPGFKGNGWRIANLEKSGFTFVQEVQAETPEAAIEQALRMVSSLTVPT